MLFFNKQTDQIPVADTHAAQNVSREAEDRTVEQVTEVCLRAAQGDLEARITGLSDDPKFGGMARAINSMLDLADSYVRESSAAMLSCSRDEYHRPILLRGLKGAYRASALVSNRGVAQMKAHNESLALVAKLASENAVAINTVAAACEELHATGSQISKVASDSLHLSQESLHHGDESIRKMEALESVFKHVDEIVSLILGISERTNLLALNASIEATRAGALGNRFSVIAKEVKELSKNSASATKGIRTQVDLMRESVEAVGTLIQTIHTSLSATTSSASTIATSIGEQVCATNEISRQIAELTSNAEKVAEQVAHR